MAVGWQVPRIMWQQTIRGKRLLGVVVVCWLVVAAGYWHAKGKPGSRVMEPAAEQRIQERAFQLASEFFHKQATPSALSDLQPERLLNPEGEVQGLPRAPAGPLPRNVTLCVGIRSVPRSGSGRQYLPSTIAGLLRGLSAEQRREIYIVVANGAVPAREHHAAFAVESFIDEMVVANEAQQRLKKQVKFVEDQRLDLFLPKLVPTDGALGRMDWIMAAEACLNRTNAPYLLLMEDDVFAYRYWYHYLTDYAFPKLGHNWFRVDLFFIDSWNGWDTDEAIYLIVACVLAALLVTALLLRRCGHYEPRIHPLALLYNFLVLASVFAAIFATPWWLNKMNVMPDRPWGLNPITGKICCAQAYLFNRQHFPALLETALDWGKYRQVDRMVNNFTRGWEKNPSFYAFPSIFQHFGVATTVEFHDGKTKLSTNFENYCVDDQLPSLLHQLKNQ